MRALWSYLIDVQLMYVDRFSTVWYPKKTFFAYFSCILPICDYYHACFGVGGGGGMFGWNLAFQVLFTSLPWILFCSSQPLSGDGVLLSNNTFTTSYLVSGGIWAGYDCLSFIPLLPDGNQLITHSYRFLDMEQTKFESCAVGSNVHCCISMKAADFTLLKSKDLKKQLFNLEKKKHPQTFGLWWK